MQHKARARRVKSDREFSHDESLEKLLARQTLNNLVNGKGGISPEMSIRLSKAFGSSPEVWLGLQMEYDLAQAEKHAHKIKVERIAADPRV